MANDLQLSVRLTGDGRQLTGTLRDAEGSVRRFGNQTDSAGQRATSAMDRTGRSVRGVNGELGEMRRMGDLARNSLLAIGGALSVREVISYSDAWTNAGNQLRMVTDSTAELERIQRDLMAVANDSRSGFESTANLYSRLARSTTEMQLSQQRLLRVTETINKSFAISGASAAEADAAITQLSQGLAAGALRGDEFNSVAEQAPEIMRAIARSLNMTIGELRAFAAEGGITAEIVVNALEGASDEIDSNFGQSIASFGQKMTLARNEMLEWIGTSDEVNTAVGVVGDSMVYLAGHMNEIVTIGQVAASLYAGRLAGSLATYTAGVIAANGASMTLTGTLRALRGVMMTTFGPVGIAVAAAGVLYTFKDELFGAVPGIDANTTAVNELTAGLDDMNRATAEVTLTRLVGQLAELKVVAQEVGEAYNQIGTDEPMAGGGILGVNVSRQVQQFREVGEASKETQQDVADVEAAIAAVTDHLATLGQRGEEVKPTITEIGDASEVTAESFERYANNLGGLLDELYPVERAQREYHQSQMLLQTAWASGEISIDRYLDALQRLEKSYESTADWQEQYGLNGQAANNAIEESIDPAVIAVERGIERLDDAFVDFWENTLSGAENTFDSFKNLAVSTLAEIIHAYTTRQITASLGLSIGGGAQGANGTGRGGFGTGGMGDLSSLGKTVYQGARDGFGSISWGGVGSSSYAGGGWAGNVASQNGMFGGGTLRNFSGMNGLASIGTGLAGGMLGSSLFGESEYGSTLSTLGGAAGTFFGGPIGAGIGSFIGSGLGSLFGSSPTPFSGRFGTNDSDARGLWEHDRYYASGALGNVGFYNGGTERLQRAGTGDKEWATELSAAAARIDNIVATLAESDAELQRMRDAVQSMQISSSSAGQIIDFALDDRPRAALESVASNFSKLLMDRVGAVTRENADQQIQQMVTAFSIGEQIDGLTGNVRSYAERVVNAGGELSSAFDEIRQGLAAHGAVDAISEQLNLQFDALGGGAVEAARHLAELAGGLDNLQQQAQTYYQQFYTDAERQQRVIEQISPTLRDVGLSAASTREQFRSVVESLNLNTESGREAYSELMNVAGAFARLTESANDSAEAQRRAAEVARQLFGLENELMRAQGANEEALRRERQRQIEQMPETLRALQREIWATEERNAAAERAADIAQQRWSLENELMRAQGSGEAALRRERERQIEQMPESLGSLQREIWAIEQRNAAADESAAAARRERERMAEQLGGIGMTSVIDDIMSRYRDTVEMSQESAQARIDQLERERQVIDTLGAAQDALRLSDQSILEPLERISEARDQLARRTVAAESSPDAVRGVEQSAQSYLQSIAEAYGQSSTEYASAYQEVLDTYNSLENRYGESIDRLGSVESIQQKALAEHERSRRVLLDQLSQQARMYDELGSVSALIGVLPENLASELGGLIGSGTGGSGINHAALGRVVEQARGDDDYLDDRGSMIVYSYLRQMGGTFDDVMQHLAPGADPWGWAQGMGLPTLNDGNSRPGGGGNDSRRNDVLRQLQSQLDRADADRNINAGEARSLYDLARANQQHVSLSDLDRMLDSSSGLYSATEYAKRHGLPQFADGGYHAGGQMLVGERGPEIVDTGPARIYNATETRQLLTPPLPGRNNVNSAGLARLAQSFERLSNELRRENADLRSENAEMIALLRSTADNTGRGADASNRTADSSERTERNTRTSRRGVSA